jgi:hypothetical protein
MGTRQREPTEEEIKAAKRRMRLMERDYVLSKLRTLDEQLNEPLMIEGEAKRDG